MKTHRVYSDKSIQSACGKFMKYFWNGKDIDTELLRSTNEEKVNCKTCLKALGYHPKYIKEANNE